MAPPGRSSIDTPSSVRACRHVGNFSLSSAVGSLPEARDLTLLHDPCNVGCAMRLRSARQAPTFANARLLQRHARTISTHRRTRETREAQA